MLHCLQVRGLTDDEWKDFRLALMRQGMTINDFTYLMVKAAIEMKPETDATI